MKYSELKELPVIDIDSGNRLGTLTDLEIDIEKMKVTAVLIQQKKGLVNWLISLFVPRQPAIIPTDKLVRTGRDVILFRDKK